MHGFQSGFTLRVTASDNVYILEHTYTGYIVGPSGYTFICRACYSGWGPSHSPQHLHKNVNTVPWIGQRQVITSYRWVRNYFLKRRDVNVKTVVVDLSQCFCEDCGCWTYWERWRRENCCPAFCSCLPYVCRTVFFPSIFSFSYSLIFTCLYPLFFIPTVFLSSFLSSVSIISFLIPTLWHFLSVLPSFPHLFLIFYLSFSHLH